jgi:hypothetical protein
MDSICRKNSEGGYRISKRDRFHFLRCQLSRPALHLKGELNAGPLTLPLSPGGEGGSEGVI